MKVLTEKEWIEKKRKLELEILKISGLICHIIEDCRGELCTYNPNHLPRDCQFLDDANDGRGLFYLFRDRGVFFEIPVKKINLNRLNLFMQKENILFFNDPFAIGYITKQK